MDCGIALFAGNGWAAFLTWVAFAVVVTAVVTFLAAVGRTSDRRAAEGALPEEVGRLSERIEVLSRRMDALERRPHG